MRKIKFIILIAIVLFAINLTAQDTKINTKDFGKFELFVPNDWKHTDKDSKNQEQHYFYSVANESGKVIDFNILIFEANKEDFLEVIKWVEEIRFPEIATSISSKFTYKERSEFKKVGGIEGGRLNWLECIRKRDNEPSFIFAGYVMYEDKFYSYYAIVPKIVFEVYGDGTILDICDSFLIKK